jgi:isopenicillin N synthase-like dioxygenase
VSEELIAEAFEQNRRFHAWPLAEKLAIKLNQWHRGYQPFATSTLVSSARFAPARHANQLESFFLRHEVPANDPGYLEQELAGPNQWPDDAGFRDVVGRYDAALTALGLGLLPAVALAVGEPADFFDGFFDPPSTTLRLIHYPPMAADGPEALFGIHPHTDYGFLTILAQDAVGGLEVQRVDGGWIAAPPISDTFVVNVGDILARWTNDAFNSTPHRVINRSPPRDRYSIGMFFDPNIETVVRCLDGFVDRARPVRFAPIRYGDYFRTRLDANYPDRVGVEAATP